MEALPPPCGASATVVTSPRLQLHALGSAGPTVVLGVVSQRHTCSRNCQRPTMHYVTCRDHHNSGQRQFALLRTCSSIFLALTCPGTRLHGPQADDASVEERRDDLHVRGRGGPPRRR